MVAAGQSNVTQEPRPVYAIFGSDDFLRRRALRQTIDQVLGADRDPMSVVEFDGPTAELAEVLDACRTMSLMAPMTVTCVRDADDFISEHRKAIERYLQSPSPTSVLVMVLNKKLSRSTLLYKEIEKIGENIPCEPPKSYELPKWVVGQARTEYDCGIDSGAARRLVELAGDDMGRLDTELAKLSTYVSPRQSIRTSDVETLVGAWRVEKVFGITDAITRKDARGALLLWDQVLANDRGAPYLAIGGLAHGFRRLAAAKNLMEQGVPVADAARQTGFRFNPSGLKAQLDRFSASEWQDHLVQLLRIDMGSKRGLGDVRSAVEKLIVELCE